MCPHLSASQVTRGPGKRAATKRARRSHSRDRLAGPALSSCQVPNLPEAIANLTSVTQTPESSSDKGSDVWLQGEPLGAIWVPCESGFSEGQSGRVDTACCEEEPGPSCVYACSYAYIRVLQRIPRDLSVQDLIIKTDCVRVVECFGFWLQLVNFSESVDPDAETESCGPLFGEVRSFNPGKLEPGEEARRGAGAGKWGLAVRFAHPVPDRPALRRVARDGTALLSAVSTCEGGKRLEPRTQTNDPGPVQPRARERSAGRVRARSSGKDRAVDLRAPGDDRVQGDS
ncbi:hypothetical protein HPG69_009950 [Diceros bicornis minor]|uniref:Uncharacterized protein n=1 Tax=Diceros bicornis minor TaxID=77932 RepID=A0A7J7FHG3_DICBM|nr:hypothetical protein HPG69_009950 [Diceros bicornis minor]